MGAPPGGKGKGAPPPPKANPDGKEKGDGKGKHLTIGLPAGKPDIFSKVTEALSVQHEDGYVPADAFLNIFPGADEERDAFVAESPFLSTVLSMELAKKTGWICDLPTKTTSRRVILGDGRGTADVVEMVERDLTPEELQHRETMLDGMKDHFRKQGVADGWRERAQAWLDEHPRAEEQTDIEHRCDGIISARFKPMNSKGNEARAHVSDEVRHQREKARLAKEAERQEKERVQLEAKKAKMAHYANLAPADIRNVPWSQAKELHFVGGGSGGVMLVDLGDECVVLKQQSKTATNEMLAQHVADCLRVRVARIRVIKRGDEDFEEVRSIAHSCDIVGTNASVALGTCFGLVDMVDAMGQSKDSDKPRLVRSGNCDIGFFGVLEFVPGHALMGLEGNQVLQAPLPTLLNDLGRLCAFDVLINNLDRVPLPVWGNDGNLGNVMVHDGGAIIGIDQQVNFVSPGPGLDAYVKKVRKIVGDCAPGGDSKGVSAQIKQAMMENCGVELSDENVVRIVQGLHAGFQEIAKEWRDGGLKRSLDDAVAESFDRFTLANVPATMAITGSMPQLGLVELMSEFICSIATQIAEEVLGVALSP